MSPPPEVVAWYEAQPLKGDMPALGTIAAGMVVLDRLRTDFSLDDNDQLTARGGQIKGLGRAAILKILSRYGIDLPRAQEGGRTNRGNVVAIRELLKALADHGVDKLPDQQRTAVIDSALEFLVARYVEWHSRQRIEPKFDPAQSTEAFIAHVLELARKKGVEGQAAQHLIGATLQRRFPGEKIENQRVSAADQQTKRGGDFQVGDRPFHITVAPAQLLIDKCAANISAGSRPSLLTRADRVALASGLAEQSGIDDRLAIQSIESFVGETVEQLAGYSRAGVAGEVRSLIELYNERVEEVEIDRGLLIEPPANL